MYQKVMSQHEMISLSSERVLTARVGEVVFKEVDEHFYEGIELQDDLNVYGGIFGQTIKIPKQNLVKEYESPDFFYYVAKKYNVTHTNAFKHCGVRCGKPSRQMGIYVLDGNREIVHPFPQTARYRDCQLLDDNFANLTQTVTYRGVEGGNLLFQNFFEKSDPKKVEEGLFFNSTSHFSRRKENGTILAPIGTKSLSFLNSRVEILDSDENSIRYKMHPLSQS